MAPHMPILRLNCSVLAVIAAAASDARAGGACDEQVGDGQVRPLGELHEPVEQPTYGSDSKAEAGPCDAMRYRASSLFAASLLSLALLNSCGRSALRVHLRRLEPEPPKPPSSSASIGRSFMYFLKTRSFASALPDFLSTSRCSLR